MVLFKLEAFSILLRSNLFMTITPGDIKGCRGKVNKNCFEWGRQWHI
jgi:hypothetical protein